MTKTLPPTDPAPTHVIATNSPKKTTKIPQARTWRQTGLNPERVRRRWPRGSVARGQGAYACDIERDWMLLESSQDKGCYD